MATFRLNNTLIRSHQTRNCAKQVLIIYPYIKSVFYLVIFSFGENEVKREDTNLQTRKNYCNNFIELILKILFVNKKKRPWNRKGKYQSTEKR